MARRWAAVMGAVARALRKNSDKAVVVAEGAAWAVGAARCTALEVATEAPGIVMATLQGAAGVKEMAQTM